MRTVETAEQFEELCSDVQVKIGQPIDNTRAYVKAVLTSLQHPLVALSAEDLTAMDAAAEQDHGLQDWLDAHPEKHVATATQFPEVWSIYQDTCVLRDTMKKIRAEKFGIKKP